MAKSETKESSKRLPHWRIPAPSLRHKEFKKVFLISCFMIGQARAFEFMAVHSGQSMTEVSTALAAAGFTAMPTDEKTLRFSKQGEAGWANFCANGLDQISTTKPFEEFPAILTNAMRSYGAGQLVVAPSDLDKTKHYVSHYWRMAGEAYSLTLIASEGSAPTEVREAWGIVRPCTTDAPIKKIKPTS